MKGTLKTRRQFAQVYELGTKATGRHVVAFALSREEIDTTPPACSIVGYVASRRVGNSVQRSRAKRLLRAGFRPLRDRLPASLWIVLIARASLADPTTRSHEVTRELESLFQRMGYLAAPTASDHA